ncbi:MAG TPA: SpoIID/LytB domain-containing protein [Stenomitos sp.]
MNQAFNAFLRSLRIWHIAPLCLPILLGSTNARVLSTANPVHTPVAIPNGLPRNLLSFDASSTNLPGRTITAMSEALRPSPVQPKGLNATAALPQKRSAAQPVKSATRQSSVQTAANPAPQPTQAALSVAALPQPARNLPPIPIRVAVATKAQSLTVATSEAGVVVDASGRMLGQMVPQTGMAAVLSPTGIQIGQSQGPSMVWIKPQSANGLVSVEGRWYRGAVQLISQPEGLLAVNHVDLESYLYSVVGAEMPASWPIHALKAQAIAARSYAIVHIARPADTYYDLGATPRWQAYNGAESETDTTQAAVNATRGILLSYKGGVVESLYASSNDIVKDVHGGFGMSQNGANQLAQQNLNYSQILARFYPGTELAVLHVQ